MLTYSYNGILYIHENDLVTPLWVISDIKYLIERFRKNTFMQRLKTRHTLTTEYSWMMDIYIHLGKTIKNDKEMAQNLE